MTDAQKMAAELFTKKICEEASDFIKAVVHFGSTTSTKTKLYSADIDILLIVDDLVKVMSAEVISGFRIIVEKVASDISPHFHINTMKLTQFWEYVRKGDPLIINILRDGRALHDDGFFRTAQNMFQDGRVKPNEEVVWAYLANAPKTLNNAKWHVTRGVMSLYWSALHSAHAALVAHSVVPQSPDQISDLLEQTFVNSLDLDEGHLEMFKELEHFISRIGHREILTASPDQFDVYKEKVLRFNKEMERLVLKKD